MGGGGGGFPGMGGPGGGVPGMGAPGGMNMEQMMKMAQAMGMGGPSAGGAPGGRR